MKNLFRHIISAYRATPPADVLMHRQLLEDARVGLLRSQAAADNARADAEAHYAQARAYKAIIERLGGQV